MRKLLKAAAPLLAVLGALACQSTDIQPIVIDLSAKSPTPATPAPTSPPPSPTPIQRTGQPPPNPPVRLELERSAPRLGAVFGSVLEVAQARVAAYNRRDVESLVALYAANARIFDPPEFVRDVGIERIRQNYVRRFSSPGWSEVEVTNQMTEGNYVVERENEKTLEGTLRSAIVISEIRDGKIVNVWILR